MRRTATSVFLAGWIGFLAVSGLAAALGILKAAAIGVPELPGLAEIVARNAETLLARGNAEILATTFAALVQFGLAAFLALALWLVHRAGPEERVAGEKLAIGALGCIGILVLAVDFGGFGLFEQFGSLLGIETVVVLSVLAVLFDRLIDVEDDADPADDEHFRVAVTLIGQRMAHDIATRSAGAERRGREERR